MTRTLLGRNIGFGLRENVYETDDGIEVSAHDVLKTAPKGYPKDHPRIELLRQKGLIYWKMWPAGPWLGTAKAKDRVHELLRAAKPLIKWLDTNVGPSQMPMR